MLQLVQSPQTGFNTATFPNSFSESNGVLTPLNSNNAIQNSNFNSTGTSPFGAFGNTSTPSTGLVPTTPTTGSTPQTIDPMLQAMYKKSLSTLNLSQEIKTAINTIYTQKGSTAQSAEFAIHAVLNEPQLAQFNIAFRYYQQNPQALQQTASTGMNTGSFGTSDTGALGQSLGGNTFGQTSNSFNSASSLGTANNSFGSSPTFGSTPVSFGSTSPFQSMGTLSSGLQVNQNADTINNNIFGIS
jgi:hypothetical protein